MRFEVCVYTRTKIQFHFNRLVSLGRNTAESCNNDSLEKHIILPTGHPNSLQQITFDNSRDASEGQFALNRYAICKEGLWIKCVFVQKFLVYHGETKGSEISSEQKLIPTKPIHQLSISDLKMSLFNEKIKKAYKASNILVCTIYEIFAKFFKFNLEPGGQD